MKLTNENLSQIKNVKLPTYDRSKLTAGIVHIGLGNFHRAHQAWYLHRLMEQGLAHDFAIIGAGVRPYDEEMRKKFAAQDYLTTLIELGPNSRSAEIIGSMIDYVPVEEGNAPLIKKMADPAIKIVSMTVTESGYFIDPATKGFDAENADIKHDAANPDKPVTAFGAIIAALKIRRDQGIPAFTCQSCDNLQGNGYVMRQTIVSLARLSDPELADWIDQNSSFPNSMVDSIVPATGPNELALAKELGIDDAVPVTHENYRQWVIEDAFCLGRPAWEKVGATISDNVHDYEMMKIRILNGGHQVIAAVGDLMGIETISGTMANPLINGFFNKVERDEIMPHVKPVPEFTPEKYVELINDRFCNAAIVDTTRRVAYDGAARQPGFVLPSVHNCLDKGITPNGLALTSALWAFYCLGVREDGTAIEPNDPSWASLNALANNAKSNARLWLENKPIFGDLVNQAPFADAFVTWFDMLNEKGVSKTLENYLA